MDFPVSLDHDLRKGDLVGRMKKFRPFGRNVDECFTGAIPPFGIAPGIFGLLLSNLGKPDFTS
jgi:hypothetical protein